MKGYEQMALREILWCGNPVLRKRAKKVSAITPDIRQLIDDMIETMIDAPGLGLAAPQVGESVRAIVLREDVGDEFEIYALINPRIVRRKGRCEMLEGCLSLPTLQAYVQRAESVVVEGLNPDGELIQVAGDGMLARALQHEIDHLDGVLFVDRADEETLAWMVPDKTDEDGYRLDPTTAEEVLARFNRLQAKKEAEEK